MAKKATPKPAATDSGDDEAAAAEPKAATKAAPRKRGASKIEAASVGLAPAELAADLPVTLRPLADGIRAAGGVVLASYREPLGGHWTLFAALPIDAVEATPYQRDISDAHVKRLAEAIGKCGRYLDPLVVVRETDGRLHTPNGHHRLAAMRSLGAKSITALVVDDPQVAFQILALNTEKAHVLKEKAMEVVRMHRALGLDSDRDEASYTLEFEEPSLVTLGLCYEKRPRFSGGAYGSILKRIEAFLDANLRDAAAVRAARADRLLALDDQVVALVAALKAKGHQSPYLKAFIVARLNPLRFKRSETLPFDDCLTQLEAAAATFDVDAVKAEDLASTSGGGGDDGSDG